MAAVLAVCTGNVCRSPAVELLLARALDVEVASAGTRAVEGSPVSPETAALLAADGLDAGGLRARRLTAPMLREARLVLVMTTAHRAAVVEEVPAALRRTFTLREATCLLDHVPLGELEALRALRGLARVDALVAALQRARTLASGALVGADLDVEDPWGRPREVYERVHARIRAEVAALLSALGA